MLTAVLVIAGCMGAFISLQPATRRVYTQRRKNKNTLLSETVGRTAAARISLSLPASAFPAPRRTATSPAIRPGGSGDEVSPEVLAAIRERVADLLGNEARISSIRPLSMPTAQSSPWAQEGRLLQISRNFGLRGRRP